MFAPNPMIERFVFPEMLPRAAQRGVGIAGGNALDPAGDAFHRKHRLEQHMHMIGHHDVGVEVVLFQLFAAKDGLFNIARKYRVTKPKGASDSLIKLGIHPPKFPACGRGTPACAFFGDTATLGCVFRDTAGSGCVTLLPGPTAPPCSDPNSRQVMKMAFPSGCQCGKLRR
jgi:hypothetical protein